MELRLLAVGDDGLEGVSDVTVLPSSGDVVARGRDARNGPWAFHVFSVASGGVTTAGRLQRLREVPASCQHDCLYGPCLLGLNIAGKDLVAVSCRECEDIQLVDPCKGRVGVAFKSSEYRPSRMCEGGPGRLWVSALMQPLIELDCTTSSFLPTGRIVHPGLNQCYGMCYLPAPYKSLILSNCRQNVVICVSTESHQDDKAEMQWEVGGELEGRGLVPMGVTFCPDQDVVAVADYGNKRIVVLDPGTGELLKTVPLCPGVGRPSQIYFREDHVVLKSHSAGQHRVKITQTSLT